MSLARAARLVLPFALAAFGLSVVPWYLGVVRAADRYDERYPWHAIAECPLEAPPSPGALRDVSEGCAARAVAEAGITGPRPDTRAAKAAAAFALAVTLPVAVVLWFGLWQLERSGQRLDSHPAQGTRPSATSRD